METAVRQVVSDAVSAAGVIDIFAESGVARPDLSLIDADFARRVAAEPRPNLQIELLRRLLNTEVRALSRTNVVAERKVSEVLERAMLAYTNRSLTGAEVSAGPGSSSWSGTGARGLGFETTNWPSTTPATSRRVSSSPTRPLGTCACDGW